MHLVLPYKTTSRILFNVLACLLISLAGVQADEPIRHRLLFTEYGKGPNRFVELDELGKLVWEFQPPSTTVIFEVQPNGNILFGYGGNPTGVREITSRGETVFDYVSNSTQVFGCERLANGNTLVAEQGPCQAVEVNPKGEIVHVTPLHTSEPNAHLHVRNVHQLANGNILAAHEGEGAIREVDPSGKVVWEYTGVTNTGDAQRLANGNTLIACGTQKRLIEVSPDKKVVWEFKAEDAPEVNLTWVSSFQQLKNGNILIGNFLRGQEGKGAHAFEVTRDKRVVWKWDDHSQIQSLTTVRTLDPRGMSLFDGKSFAGWQGDTETVWRIEDGALVAGSLKKKQQNNNFLATTKEFTNFELRLKWKLEGTEGFVNGGVQFRSKRIPNDFEVIGYQADLGAGFDGALYDESRRKKVLMKPSPEVLAKATKPLGEWNDYRIRAEGKHIQLWLNGFQTVDYTETEPGIAETGMIAVQIHGNATSVVRYKDIELTELRP
jgi:Domain of Unknown Function (DUF1080)